MLKDTNLSNDFWEEVLERLGLSLYQKIHLSFLNTTNSLIEPWEVVNPFHESCEGC